MIKYLALAFAAFIFLVPGQAHADDPVFTGLFSNKAVSGYDTVSYFSGNPVKGSEEFSTEWNGATWFFSSAGNLAKFKVNLFD